MTAFGYPELTVKEYEHWTIQLRASHVTLGSLVVVAKSGATNLGKLSEEEWAEFAVVSYDLEELLKEKFGAEKFNYLALMMYDPNVHFHVIPRYSKSVEFQGREYFDRCWPEKTDLETIEISDQELKAILEYLKS